MMRDDIARVAGDDQDIAAAIAEAQRRLPDFRRIVEENTRYIVPPYGIPMVKVCIENETSGDVEHICLEGVAFEESVVVGQIATAPTHLPMLKEGMQCRAPVSKITDWVYYEGGKMHGGFVERILKKRAGIGD